MATTTCIRISVYQCAHPATSTTTSTLYAPTAHCPVSHAHRPNAINATHPTYSIYISVLLPVHPPTMYSHYPILLPSVHYAHHSARCALILHSVSYVPLATSGYRHPPLAYVLISAHPIGPYYSQLGARHARLKIVQHACPITNAHNVPMCPYYLMDSAGASAPLAISTTSPISHVRLHLPSRKTRQHHNRI